MKPARLVGSVSTYSSARIRLIRRLGFDLFVVSVSTYSSARIRLIRRLGFDLFVVSVSTYSSARFRLISQKRLTKSHMLEIFSKAE